MSRYANLIEARNQITLNYNPSSSKDVSTVVLNRWQTVNDAGTGDVVNGDPDYTGTLEINPDYSSWSSYTADNGDNQISACMINGYPAVAYNDPPLAFNLKFAINTTGVDSGPYTTSTIVTEGVSSVSLALINSKPAVAYHGVTSVSVRFAINSAADGSGSWTVSTIQNIGFNATSYVSLATIGGFPAIAYCGSSFFDLRYASNSAVDGSGTWTVYNVDITNDVGLFCSLKEVMGRPGVAHFDFTNNDLRYSTCTLSNGSGTWSNYVVDSTGNTGGNPSLSVINGKPAITYYDLTNATIRYAISSNVYGTSSWSTSTIETVGGSLPGTDPFPSLTTINGYPAIGYMKASTNQMRFAYNSAVDGTGSWTINNVASKTADSWTQTCLFDFSDRAMMFFFQNGFVTKTVKYALVSFSITPVKLPNIFNSGEYSSTTTDYYKDWWIKITNDTPAGILNEVRQITAYDGSTRIPTYGTAWSAGNPTQTTTFALYQSNYILPMWDEVNNKYIYGGVPLSTTTVLPTTYRGLDFQVKRVGGDNVNIGKNTTINGYNYTVVGGKTEAMTLGVTGTTYNHCLIKDLPFNATIGSSPAVNIPSSELVSGELTLSNGSSRNFPATSSIATELGVLTTTFPTYSSNVISFRTMFILPTPTNTATLNLGTGQQWTNRTASSALTVTGSAELIFEFTSATTMLITVLT